MKKRWIGLIALTVVAIGTLGYTGFAYAQAEQAEWSDFVAGTYVPASFNQDKGFDGDRPKAGVLREYVTAAIAEALDMLPEELTARKEAGETLIDIAAEAGIAEEDLPDVLQAAFETAIENALADGAITEEQAARILEHGANGPGKGPGGRPGNGGPEGEQPFKAIFEGAVEDVLGLTRDEMKARFEAGETFEEIIASQGFDTESFQTAVKAELTDRVNQAVEDGTITQEQADLLLERIESADGFPNGGNPGSHSPKGPHGPKDGSKPQNSDTGFSG